MPAPSNERSSLEREIAELPNQIATRQGELAATAATDRARRECREWQIRRLQQRLGAIEARLASISAER